MKILNQNNQEILEIDFGVVEVGKVSTLTYTLWNDEECELKDIDIRVENKEVQVTYPQQMNPFEKANIEFVWTPTLEIKKGLKSKFLIIATQLWK